MFKKLTQTRVDVDWLGNGVLEENASTSEILVNILNIGRGQDQSQDSQEF